MANFIKSFFYWMSTIFAILGIITFIIGFGIEAQVSDTAGFICICSGLSMVFTAPFLYAIAYIMETAITYRKNGDIKA